MKNRTKYTLLALLAIIISTIQVDTTTGNDKMNKKENYIKSDLRLVYFPSGTLKCKHHKPSGEYTTYYENGNIEEKGTWKMYNINDLHRYYSDGTLWQKLHYNADGDKSGKQTFYYQDGKVAMEGYWEDGRLIGKVKRYDKSERIKSDELDKPVLQHNNSNEIVENLHRNHVKGRYIKSTKPHKMKLK